MGRTVGLFTGEVVGAAAPGTTIDMLPTSDSLTLDRRGGLEPYVIGLLCSTTAIGTREAYVNYRASTEDTKDQVYRRIYPTLINDAPVQKSGYIIFPIEKQFKRGDILDIRSVDVGTTVLHTVGVLICWGGPPEYIERIPASGIWAVDFTAGTPADLATTYTGAGVDDIASGDLSGHPRSMKVIGGYMIMEDAQGMGVKFEQTFENSIKPGITPGNGILQMPDGRILVIATIDNDTPIQVTAAAVAATECEAGIYCVQG